MAVKYLDLNAFVEIGFLQEANRQFFHPLGLALEVVVAKDGSAMLGGIWDYREDPEGMTFGEGYGDDIHKAVRVAREKEKHLMTRVQMFGSAVQPLSYGKVTTETEEALTDD